MLTILRTAGTALRQSGPRGLTQHVLRRAFLEFMVRRKEMIIVQIGAYVGTTGNDPLMGFLRRHFDPTAPGFMPNARAILIEPVPTYFSQLQQNYAHLQNIIYENVAIADALGERPFYRLGVDPKEFGMPDWLSQLASLRADRMTALWDRNEATHGNPAEWQAFYNAHLVADPVKCETLANVLSRHDVGSVDLLVIDTEGYDYEILKTIDFRSVRPRFVNYERSLLGSEEPQCRQMMRDAGYRLLNWDQDTLCW